MPAVIAVPAIMGAAGIGANLIGAKMSSNAAKDAAKLQVAATDKAQGFNERVYGDQKELMKPYVSAGSDSLARLMASHWGTPLPTGMAPSGGNSAMLSNAAQMNTPRPAGPQYGPQFQPTQPPPGSGMTLGAMQAQGQPGAGAPPQGSQTPQGMVRVKAPTGEIALLPDGSPGLQMALQKGAVRV